MKTKENPNVRLLKQLDKYHSNPHLTRIANLFDALLKAAKKGLNESESYIYDQYEGTSELKVQLRRLSSIRKAIKDAEK